MDYIFKLTLCTTLSAVVRANILLREFLLPEIVSIPSREGGRETLQRGYRNHLEANIFLDAFPPSIAVRGG